MQDIEVAYRVRTLQETDAKGLADLSCALGGAETPSDWRERLRAERTCVVGAEADERLIGYAAGAVRTAFGQARPAGWIEAFAVALDWRGRGLGRALLASLLDDFRRFGAERVYTVVARHDRAMAPFLREIGFREELLLCLGRAL